MQKFLKQSVLIIIDIIICVISMYLAFYLVLGPHLEWADYHASSFLKYIVVTIAVMVTTHTIFGMYRTKWEYASIREMLKIVITLLIFNAIIFVLSRVFIYPERRIPERVFLIFAVVNTMLIMGYRISYRVMGYLKAEYLRMRGGEGGRILIIGAGDAGRLLQLEINKASKRGYVVGFLDDDISKSNTSLSGTKIYGRTTDILEVVKKLEIDEIMIALPSSKSSRTKEVLNLCTQTPCKILIMPSMQDMVDGSASVSQLRKVEPEDLLGRDPVDLNIEEISEYISNKVILITGAGGSIGSELCRQIAKYSPKRMILVDIYENNIFDLEHELKRNHHGLMLDGILASVRDIKRLDVIFNTYKPDIVFHAAAHKHVPLVEFSPGEAVKNNVFGTKNVATMADKHGVDRFVLISTDKAVNPTNVMGATKRIAEYIVGCMNNISKTKFVAVRFGNVLGSNGSVIPLFKKQIEVGGPVTVTHPDITRYFMTIPEAAQLVLQAGGMADQGTMFILDMGDAVKIDDLARNLIHLSGLVPDEDIEIVYTGLRPGEKMYEELLTQKENLKKTSYKKIFFGNAENYDNKLVCTQLEKLRKALDGDDRKVINIICEMVPEFISKVIVTDFTMDYDWDDNKYSDWTIVNEKDSEKRKLS